MSLQPTEGGVRVGCNVVDLRAPEIAFGCRDMECHLGGRVERACERLRGTRRQFCGFGKDVRLCPLRHLVECNPRVKGLKDSGEGRPL